MTRHARQELVRRLDAYEHASAPLFKKVAAFIETQVVPVIVRHALAGRCLVKTDDALFQDETAVDMMLDTLTERERRVLSLRFGLVDGYSRTLEEVGKQFKVTRERIRQIEAKALRKLKHPSRSRSLRSFLDN